MEPKNFSQSAWSYITVFVILSLLRLIDLYLTYQLTPDLSEEQNPLISHLNLSWTAFLAVQLFLVLFALVGYHRYAQRIRNPVETSGLRFLQFIYHYFNGNEFPKRNWLERFIKLPNKRRLKIHGAFVGFVIIASFLLTSVFAIIHNILIFNNDRIYLEFVLEYGEVYFSTTYVSLVFLSANLFFVLEYGNYRKLKFKR